MDIDDNELYELAIDVAGCVIDDLISERGTQSDHLWDEFGDRIDGLDEDESNKLHERYQGALRRVKAALEDPSPKVDVVGPPPPGSTYEEMWKVLAGYVEEAVQSPRPDDAKSVQGTMSNLEHEHRAPIKAWMDRITGKAAAK